MATSTQIIEDPDSDNALPRRFYNRALWLLMQGPQTNGTGQYSERDAVAAVQLIAYSLLGVGSTDWQIPLECACEWLSQTGLNTEENPKLVLLNMSPAARFAAKATMVRIQPILSTPQLPCAFSSFLLLAPPRFHLVSV